MTYLDNAATTFPKPEEVYLSLDKANREYAFNSGRGSYKKAKEISKIIDETRKEIGEFVGVDKNKVVFSTSATESLNIIIFGSEWKEGDNVYVTPFEHNSILRPLEEIKKRYNINIEIIPFDKKTWEVSENIDDIFALKKPKYIFCSAKSNVTGYELPYQKIFELGNKYKSINILDASQSFGVDKNITCENVDFIVFAGHKSLYASFGIAGFIDCKGSELKKFLFGGTGSDSLNMDMPNDLPNKYEAGSKNSVAIYGLNESVKWIKKNDIKGKEKMLFSYFCDKIKDNKKIITYLPENTENFTGIISINVKGYTADEVGVILDEEFDICVRTGYHCSPLVHDFIDSKEYYGTVRISFNYFNTTEDIDRLIEALETL